MLPDMEVILPGTCRARRENSHSIHGGPQPRPTRPDLCQRYRTWRAFFSWVLPNPVQLPLAEPSVTFLSPQCMSTADHPEECKELREAGLTVQRRPFQLKFHVGLLPNSLSRSKSARGLAATRKATNLSAPGGIVQVRSGVVCPLSIRYFTSSKSPRFDLRDQLQKEDVYRYTSYRHTKSSNRAYDHLVDLQSTYHVTSAYLDFCAT